MWTNVLTANSREEFELFKDSNYDIPAGTDIKITIDLPAWLPIGDLVNLAGAEWVMGFFVNAQVNIKDVYGDARHIYITGTATGTPLTLIVVAILAIAIAAGLYFLDRVVIDADLKTVVKGIGDVTESVAKTLDKLPWLLPVALVGGVLLLAKGKDKK